MGEQSQTTPITEELVIESLKECYDPEIPVNVVELGLIYDVKIIDDWVGVKMTLESQGSRTLMFASSGNPPGHRPGCRRKQSANSECPPETRADIRRGIGRI
jgi:hypothetical protein